MLPGAIRCHDGHCGVTCRSRASCRPAMKRAAVVANPTKYDDKEKFRDLVCTAMSEHGWDEPLWLETTVDVPGTGQARAALAAGGDLVLASGGDGTGTACAAAIAGSGIPLGLIPSGTGNLLARNLGLPLELDQALVVALAGADRPLDVGRANGKAFTQEAHGAGRILLLRAAPSARPADAGDPAGRWPAAAAAAGQRGDHR